MDMCTRINETQKLLDNFNEFISSMLDEIFRNLDEKGFTWRDMDLNDLYGVLKSYIDTNNYEAIANVAFMMWEINNKKE